MKGLEIDWKRKDLEDIRVKFKDLICFYGKKDEVLFGDFRGKNFYKGKEVNFS